MTGDSRSMYARELALEIYESLQYGECLYDKNKYRNLLRDIDKMKDMCSDEFRNNQGKNQSL